MCINFVLLGHGMIRFSSYFDDMMHYMTLFKQVLRASDLGDLVTLEI